MRVVLAWLLSAAAALAEGERPGDFDYYVLSLSWSPTWCALEGDARSSPQCRDDNDFGWVLHGLWPQYLDGWPSYCPSARRNPSRADTAAMADIMGSPGNAWHQWKKHGRCAGLAAGDYFALAREAYERIVRPEVLRRLDRSIRLPAQVIEDAFLEANPHLGPEGVTVTCKAGRIQEVRICLTRSLEPRACTGSVARDCTLRDALLDPIR